MENSLENVIRYEYASLAGHLAQSKEGQQYLPGALKSQMNRLEGDAATSTEIAIKHGGVEDIIKAYTGKRQDAMNLTSVGTLSEYYGKNLDSYLDGTEAKKIRLELGKFADETFGDITKKLKKAKYVLDGEEHGELSDEKKNSAEAVLKKYENVMLILGMLENDKIEKLRPSAVEQSHKEALKEIAGKL